MACGEKKQGGENARKNNYGEPIQMKNKGAEGLFPISREAAAANEEFTAIASRREKVRPDRAGSWDPFEVWRTRVKASGGTKPKHARDPLR